MLTSISPQKLKNKNSPRKKTFRKSRKSSLSAVAKEVLAKALLQSILLPHLKTKDLKSVFLMLTFMDLPFQP